jgi:hypothetical protein
LILNFPATEKVSRTFCVLSLGLGKSATGQ